MAKTKINFRITRPSGKPPPDSIPSNQSQPLSPMRKWWRKTGNIPPRAETFRAVARVLQLGVAANEYQPSTFQP
jgi:hypothetical protein